MNFIKNNSQFISIEKQEIYCVLSINKLLIDKTSPSIPLVRLILYIMAKKTIF